jgi:hypothetical protein
MTRGDKVTEPPRAAGNVGPPSAVKSALYADSIGPHRA